MNTSFQDLKIAVAGTDYVGLSIATLLAQKHQVGDVDGEGNINTKSQGLIVKTFLIKFFAENLIKDHS